MICLQHPPSSRARDTRQAGSRTAHEHIVFAEPPHPLETSHFYVPKRMRISDFFLLRMKTVVLNGMRTDGIRFEQNSIGQQGEKGVGVFLVFYFFAVANLSAIFSAIVLFRTGVFKRSRPASVI